MLLVSSHIHMLWQGANKNHNMFLWRIRKVFPFWQKKVPCLEVCSVQYEQRVSVCLCWGFTAQSTQWDHVERVSLPNHTFTGQAWSSRQLTSIVHILSPETDNCPSWRGPLLSIYFMISDDCVSREQRSWSDCTKTQADLSICWLQLT